MSLIRPELSRAFRRWHEVFWPSLGALYAVRVATLSHASLVARIGMGVVALICVTYAIVAFRKAKLRVASEHANGHVDITERQITYYFRGEGFSLSLNDLTQMRAVAKDQGSFWQLRDRAGTILMIPTVAGGANDLPEALSALGQIDYQGAAAVINSKQDDEKVIWSRD